MSRERVCFVLPSFDLGGAQRVALNLLGALDKKRFAPSLIVFQSVGPLAEEVPEGVHVNVLKSKRLRGAFLRLATALSRARPSVVFSTLGYVNLAVLMLRPLLPAGARIIVRESNTPSDALPKLAYSGLIKIGYRLLYRSADRIICQSHRITHELETYYGVPPQRLVRLPNPVNEEGIRKAALRPVRVAGAGSRFVGVGALIEQKGFDRLIKLFARAPRDSHLTIIGDGPQREALIADAQHHGVESRITFMYPNVSPWQLVAGADALLLPSRWEGMPNVALEALACGTRVIGTPESGGLTEVAEEAPPGAVTLAAMDEEFLRAMREIGGNPPEEPRQSLLPSSYRIASVASSFTNLITRVR